MCGIAGIYSLTGETIIDAESRIWQMTNSMDHRGPDYQNVFLSDNNKLALGYARLAITDPNDRTSQPLQTTDKKSVFVFNGEIYDYLERRSELEEKNIHFRTRMDTEVLLEGFNLEGDEFLKKIDGIWAFAHYDLSKERLLLSRDLLGERHLYYWINQKEIIFASEVKPILLAANKHSFNINLESVLTAFHYYTCAPGASLIDGINRLLPGYNMVIGPDREVKTYQYRKLHPEKWFDFFNKEPSIDVVINKYEEIFHTQCKRRIPVDIPFISTLSGGIDSTLVSTFASDFGNKKINTFFAQSSESTSQLDELEISLQTADKLNTFHQVTRIDSEEIIDPIKRLSKNGFEGQLEDTTPFEMLSRFVRDQGLKVILVSDGPDELVGGYTIDQKAYSIDNLKQNNPLGYRLCKIISQNKILRKGFHYTRLKKNLMHKYASYEPFKFHTIHEGTSTAIPTHLFHCDVSSRILNHYGTINPEYEELCDQLDYSQMRALSYATKSLPDHFNLRTDKSFMQASVEGRLPHQAPEMVEFLIAMPAKFRFNKGNDTKYILREVVKKHVGGNVHSQPKRGFASYLWNSPVPKKAIDYKKDIYESDIFENLPFKKNAREIILKSYNKDFWKFYQLIRTYDNLKSICRNN